jgi:DNA-binding transcriptional LysR family regulator
MSSQHFAKLDIDLLLALDALLEEPNVTRAAKRLSIQQSALSARLTRLRVILDDRLFIPSPSGRGVLPTPRALALQPVLTKVLQGLKEMVELRDQFDPMTSDRTFTIALFDNPAAMLGPDLVARLRAAAPNARLRLVTPNSAQMMDLLESGRVDIFIGLRSKAHDSWISRTLLVTDFVTAQRKAHARGQGPLDLDQFCALDHLLVSAEGSGFAGYVDDALSLLGRHRRVAVSIQSYALAPIILATSDFLCTLPRRFLQRFTATLDLFGTPLHLDEVEFVAHWHPRQHEDAGHAWFREQVFAIASLTA